MYAGAKAVKEAQLDSFDIIERFKIIEYREEACRRKDEKLEMVLPFKFRQF